MSDDSRRAMAQTIVRDLDRLIRLYGWYGFDHEDVVVRGIEAHHEAEVKPMTEAELLGDYAAKLVVREAEIAALREQVAQLTQQLEAQLTAKP